MFIVSGTNAVKLLVMRSRRLCDFFHSFVLQECMCADFFVTDMSIHILVRSCMPQFPVGEIGFCGVVRNVLCSILVSPF